MKKSMENVSEKNQTINKATFVDRKNVIDSFWKETKQVMQKEERKSTSFGKAKSLWPIKIEV